MNKKLLKIWLLRAMPFLLILLKMTAFASAGGGNGQPIDDWA